MLSNFFQYTEANSQRNTDFGVHFFVFIFIKIIFMENTFRQLLKFDCADKNIYFATHGRAQPFRQKQEIMLHMELVGFIW